MKPHSWSSVGVGTAAALIALAAVADASSDVPLKPVSAFSGIGDERARSIALFTEAAKVIQHPRCMNCHPVTRQPTQGDDLHAHIPPMHAGSGDHGVQGLPCRSCHGPANQPTLVSSIKSIPGNPRWGLAPISMAWQGKSLREICEQIKIRTGMDGAASPIFIGTWPPTPSSAGRGTREETVSRRQEPNPISASSSARGLRPARSVREIQSRA